MMKKSLMRAMTVIKSAPPAAIRKMKLNSPPPGGGKLLPPVSAKQPTRDRPKMVPPQKAKKQEKAGRAQTSPK